MAVARELQDKTVATHKTYVRAQLKRFGVSPADMEDLIQEVWIVALARSPKFDDERATRAWLTQVCRRVAAGARRTRGRAPLLHGEVPELPVEPEQMENIEVELDEQLCMAALSRLDERQLDVLTLYGGGDLSMREVAELVGEPEATVYSRYRSAIQELSRELRREGAKPRRSSFPPAFSSEEVLHLSEDAEAKADRGQLILYRADDRLVMGRIGNVIVARWRRRAYEDSLRAVGRAVDDAYQHLRRPIVLCNDVESDIRTLSAAERSTMREAIRASSDQLAIVADIYDTPFVRVGGAIIRALMLITRSTTSFVVVPTLEQSRRWVVPHASYDNGPLPFEKVAHAVRILRAVP